MHVIKLFFFDSFEVEHVPKEIEKFIGHKKNKNKKNTYLERKQTIQ